MKKVRSGLTLFMAGLMFLVSNYLGTAIAAITPTLAPWIVTYGDTAVEEQEKALLEKIKAQVEKVTELAGKEKVNKADLDKTIKEINAEISKLSKESLKDLKASVDKMSASNETLQEELKAAKEQIKNQGTEINKLKDVGAGQPKKDVKLSFRDAVKEAILAKKDIVITEKRDNPGDDVRFSLKDYFVEKGNKTTPTFTLKVAVDMLESNIVNNNVNTVRLTQLDPTRVGIPLNIYPHVFDWMMSKSISRPYMSLLVVYSYEDGVATKTEGAASGKSSFLFKTVEFKAFTIATHFVMSDETLDDLEEALDEINSVAPDKILDKIDSKIISAAGDDSTDIKGVLHADKSTAFSNPYSDDIVDAYIVDVIEAMKLQCMNNRYKPSVVVLSPEAISKIGTLKNTFEDSKFDRRVVYNAIGEPTYVSGLLVVKNTDLTETQIIVADNKQPWIGKRKDMSMEIGYNGNDLTEGQKTVVFKVRLAFGVRDKAGIIYCSNSTAAAATLAGS